MESLTGIAGTEGLWGLFFTAFLAATILPVSSEILLGAMAYDGSWDQTTLWGAATAGNVLGSVVNYLLGRYLLRFAGRRWFPVSRETLEKGHDRFMRWGTPSLLLAWMPIIGDPLTFVAGIVRVPWPLFLLLVTISKGGRYAALLWLV